MTANKKGGAVGGEGEHGEIQIMPERAESSNDRVTRHKGPLFLHLQRSQAAKECLFCLMIRPSAPCSLRQSREVGKTALRSRRPLAVLFLSTGARHSGEVFLDEGEARP